MDTDALVAQFHDHRAAEVELQAALKARVMARRQIVADLYAGRSLAEVADLLGITRARVHQLLNGR